MASKQSHSASLLKARKPEAKQLNKKLIMGLSAIVGVVLLLIISMAFSGGKAPSQDNAIAVPGASNIDTTPLSHLPSGYQDAQSIQNIMDRARPKADNSALLAQLSELRQAQSTLQQQMAKMQGGVAKSLQNTNDPMSREAMTSSIFFAGGAPAQTPQQQPQTADQKKDEKPNADAKSLPSDPYVAQNAQGQKTDFLSSKPSKEIYNTNGVQYPVSKYELQAGTVVPAILQTELNSDLPGFIVGVVRQNVYDSINGQYLLIPKGSKLIGEYSSIITYGQSSLQAKFTRLIRPDGSSVVLPSATGGVNGLGVSGMSDEVNNHWGAIIGAGVLMAVFNIPSIIATNQMNSTASNNCQPGQYCPPSNTSALSASAWQSVGQASANLGNAISQKSLNIQPTVTVHAGYEFAIIVTKDIVLPPYTPVMESIPQLGN